MGQTKILLIKTGAMGDVLRTTSLLPVLKKKYSDVHLTWLVYKSASELLANNPDIDRIIEVERGFNIDFAEEEFDIVINLEESKETSILAESLGVELIGFGYRNGKVYPSANAKKYWQMGELGPSPENNILKKLNDQSYQELMLEILDIKAQCGPPVYKLTTSSVDIARSFLKSIGSSQEKKLLGINFGSGTRWPTKRLPLKFVQDLISRIDRTKYEIMLFGGSAEKEHINKLKDYDPSLFICDSKELSVFAAILSFCSLLITTDTLALHLALSQGVKVLALFGPTSVNEIELFGLGKKCPAPMDCVCCYLKECTKSPFCMSSFDKAELIAYIEHTLA